MVWSYTTGVSGNRLGKGFRIEAAWQQKQEEAYKTTQQQQRRATSIQWTVHGLPPLVLRNGGWRDEVEPLW